MSAVVLPLPEPPDAELAGLLELIAFAREELREAHRIVTMLAGAQEEPAAELRRLIESAAAERRAELWALQLVELEERRQQLLNPQLPLL